MLGKTISLPGCAARMRPYHRSQEIPDCYRGDNTVWTADWYHHYRWCLGVSYEQARDGDDMRGSRLHECGMAAYGHL
jgi:hypothetical protein